VPPSPGVQQQVLGALVVGPLTSLEAGLARATAQRYGTGREIQPASVVLGGVAQAAGHRGGRANPGTLGGGVGACALAGAATTSVPMAAASTEPTGRGEIQGINKPLYRLVKNPGRPLLGWELAALR